MLSETEAQAGASPRPRQYARTLTGTKPGRAELGSHALREGMGSLMYFMDPEELDGLHVIGRNDVTIGVVEGTYADIRS